MKPTYFVTGGEFRAWLEANHSTVTELLLGFYKKASGNAGIRYQEALDEALAFGWIDGVRRSVDDKRYTIRFTPRKPRSIWSALKRFKADKKAWAFFQTQAPWYRRTSTHLVMSAKRPETRARRLEALIAYSRQGERIPMLTPPTKPAK